MRRRRPAQRLRARGFWSSWSPPDAELGAPARVQIRSVDEVDRRAAGELEQVVPGDMQLDDEREVERRLERERALLEIGSTQAGAHALVARAGLVHEVAA